MKIGRTIAVFAVAMGVLAGCQQYASYPPVEVTANMQRPQAEPVPTIIAQTVRYARERYAVSPDLSLNLPEGVPTAVYDRVFAHLGGGRAMHSASEKALHITQIRTRGVHAQVDLIYPTANGFNEFVTVHLEHPTFGQWRVVSDQRWAIGNVNPPASNYSPAPPGAQHTAVATP